MRRSQIITVCVLAIISVIAFMIHAPGRSDPVYEGKRLSEWLVELDRGPWPRNGIISPADQAIWNLGTNAFPRILQLLHARSSPPRAALVAFLNQQQLRRIHITTDNDRHFRGLKACSALGSAAEPLVPGVAEALSHMKPFSRSVALDWLGSLGVRGGAATPALIQRLQDTNDPTRFMAARNLAAICGQRRAEAVLALKACLRDRDQFVRVECTNALKLLGEAPAGTANGRE